MHPSQNLLKNSWLLSLIGRNIFISLHRYDVLLQVNAPRLMVVDKRDAGTRLKSQTGEAETKKGKDKKQQRTRKISESSSGHEGEKKSLISVFSVKNVSPQQHEHCNAIQAPHAWSYSHHADGSLSIAQRQLSCLHDPCGSLHRNTVLL